MTSLHSTTHQYASTTTPFQILPSCRFHGDQQQPTDSSNNTILTGSSLSRRQSTNVNSNPVHDWNVTPFHHAEKLVYSSNGNVVSGTSTTAKTTTTTTTTLPLHTDPEMYALKSKQSSTTTMPKASSSSSPVTVKPTQYVNNRLAYVEALVDTNAHVIETIWSTSPTSSSLSLSSSSSSSSTSSSYSKSAVVPLRTFIQEVLKRSRTTYSTLQTALFYLFRARPAILAQLYERNSNNTNYPYWQDAYISCGRRMFLASLVIASKFVQDKTYRNSAWAKIAGLPVSEINAAERIFLDLIDYRLYIAQPTFEQWHHLLHLHVESRALNRPIPLLHDLSCLPTGNQQTKPFNHQLPSFNHQHHQHSQYQLPSPQSPTDIQQQHPHFSLPALMNNNNNNNTSCDHYYQHYNEQQSTRRKRRLRETSMDNYQQQQQQQQQQHYRHPYSMLSPPPSCSPSSNGGSTTTSNGYSPSAGIHHHHGPPVLSLSLPSSSSSSPMHTPTQISPVRMNQHTLPLTTSWKMNQNTSTISPPPSATTTHYGGRPFMVSDVRQQTPDYFSHPPTSSKKRRMTMTTATTCVSTAFDPYPTMQQQQGYAVSHVRGMKRKQYKPRQ